MMAFLCLKTREVFVTESTEHPDSAWVCKQTEWFIDQTKDREKKPEMLIHDRDLKFGKGGVYLEAMSQRRWNGKIPKCATRVEYQLTRGFFSRWQQDTAKGVLDNLGGITEYVTRIDSRPFFVLTDAPPDRKNKHQSRVGVHREWDRIVKTFVARAGKPTGPLEPVDRGRIKSARAYRTIRGYLTSIAAVRGWPVDSIDDAVELLRHLDETYCEFQDEWRNAWELKARKNGTLDGLTDFPFGTAA